MMKENVVRKMTMLLSLSFLLSGCLGGKKSCPIVYEKKEKSEVVAKVLGQDITYAELIKGIEGEIFEAEEKVHQLKEAQFKMIVLKKLREQDPKGKDLTEEEFIDKVVIKGLTPKESDIEKFIVEKNIPKEHVNADLKERVKAFLLNEMKRDAIDDWINKKLESNPASVYFYPPERPTFDIKVGDAPTYGGENAKVTIVEFSDFQCPFCAKGKALLDQIKKEYGSKVKIAFKNFPLSFHKDAHNAAQAGLCAKDQGINFFWKMHDEMFEDQQNIAISGLEEKAKKIGLKMDQFKECLSTQKHKASVDAQFQEGLEVGVKSTPTFFVNGKLIMGAASMEVFSELIDQELEK